MPASVATRVATKGTVLATWAEREGPLLAELAKREDRGEKTDWADLMEATGLDERATQRSLRRLFDADYLTGHDVTTFGSAEHELIGIRLLEKGLRATGVWPDDGYQAFLAELDAKIEVAAPDERSRLERLRDGVIGVGRDVATDLISAVLRGQAGL
jgi:hypothetical protein